MKYCTKCGQQIHDEAVICIHCGCSTAEKGASNSTVGGAPDQLLNSLSQKIHTNAILWMVLGVIQCVTMIGIIAGIWNIYAAWNDLKYSKECLTNPRGIVQRFEPVNGYIIALVINLVLGGVIGVVGVAYEMIAIRGFVMENKSYFEQFDESNAM